MELIESEVIINNGENEGRMLFPYYKVMYTGIRVILNNFIGKLNHV